MADLRWFKIEEKIPEGDFVMEVKVAGKKLCLVRHDGQMHLLQNSCPHAGGVMSGGWCEKGQVVCPIHRYAYNLETGRGAQGQGDYIDIYPLREEDGVTYAGIKQSLFSRFFGGR
jgi:nitrite reductase/ring-hydroxylating ferredoxin subunit